MDLLPCHCVELHAFWGEIFTKQGHDGSSIDPVGVMLPLPVIFITNIHKMLSCSILSHLSGMVETVIGSAQIFCSSLTF